MDKTTLQNEPGETSSQDIGGPGVSLLDILTALGEQKRIFYGITIVGTAVALAFALTVQRYYSASTLIMPPQQPNSAASTLAQLGQLSGLAGMAVSTKAPDEIYLALLKTRRLQDALIDRFKLAQRFQTALPTDSRTVLSQRVTVSSDKKSGLITVVVDDTDPTFAAKLADAHVDELRKLLSTLAVTDAQQRRHFFENQVTKTQSALNTAEELFRQMQTENGMVVTQVLAESGVKSGVELRGQIAAIEIQLQALGRFATTQNSESQRLAAELAARRAMLKKIEQGKGSAGDAAPGSSKSFETVRAYRNMKVQEASLEALIKHLELAKLDESREGPLLQQIDPAAVPDRPSKPKRIVIAGGGALVALLLGGFIAINRAMANRRKPSAEWQKFKNAWGR